MKTYARFMLFYFIYLFILKNDNCEKWVHIFWVSLKCTDRKSPWISNGPMFSFILNFFFHQPWSETVLVSSHSYLYSVFLLVDFVLKHSHCFENLVQINTIVQEKVLILALTVLYSFPYSYQWNANCTLTHIGVLLLLACSSYVMLFISYNSSDIVELRPCCLI